MLREADRELAKGLTVSDICRKIGIAETTYYRWRQQHDPEQVYADRRCRELELEVDRLKRLVAELLLDKQMLQDFAKKVVNPDQQRAAADYQGERYKISQRRISRVMRRSRSVLRYRPSRRANKQPCASAEPRPLPGRHGTTCRPEGSGPDSQRSPGGLSSEVHGAARRCPLPWKRTRRCISPGPHDGDG